LIFKINKYIFHLLIAGFGAGAGSTQIVTDTWGPKTYKYCSGFRIWNDG